MAPTIRVSSLVSGESKILVEGAQSPRYVPTGHLVYVQRGVLFAAAFDEETLELGNPQALVRNVYTNVGSGWWSFAFSESGTLVYFEDAAGDAKRRLWRVDLDRTRRQLPCDRAQYYLPRLSPDDTRLAVEVRDERLSSKLWLFDLQREIGEPLTQGRHWNLNPTFSTDGDRLLYAAEDQEHVGFRVRSLRGAGRDEALPRPVVPANFTWRFDGTIAYANDENGTDDSSTNIWVLETPNDEPRVLIGGPSSEHHPMFSPDGGLLAFVSEISGRSEIYSYTRAAQALACADDPQLV